MRLSLVGRNPRSGGSECVIFGEVGRRDGVFAPLGRGADADGWEARAMRPGAGLEEAPALVGWREREQGRRTNGRLVLLAHRWSGVLQINDIGRKYTVDLYSEETRLVLLDEPHEVLIEVTALARVENGALVLPPLTPERLAAHVGEATPWMHFLELDADFAPGLLRRGLEALRRPPDERLKRRLVASLLPALIVRPPPPADSGLRDEVALLAAAVEGLALRARAEA